MKRLRFKNKKACCLFVILIMVLSTSLTILSVETVNTFQEYISNGDVDIISVADEEPSWNEAYFYEDFVPPSNSFGIGNTTFRTVNWSYFKQLFQDHFYKDAMYKRYSYSNWQNGNQYVTVDKTWNETENFWKIDINLDIPVDLYEVNISFGCDIPVLQYVERDGYEIWLNYSANATEFYQVYFNWSDIASIPGLSITKHRNLETGIWWISLHRQNVLAGYYSFDPQFGVDSPRGTTDNPNDDVLGSIFLNTNGTGTADSIFFYINGASAFENYGFALYDNDTKQLMCYTDDLYGTAAAGEWIEGELLHGDDMNISDNHEYTVTILSGANMLVYYDNNDIGCGVVQYTVSEDWAYYPIHPWEPDIYVGGMTYACYVTFTASGGAVNQAPELTGQAPVNGSTDIVNGCVDMYVIVSDDDGDTCNATWGSNSSGSWVEFAYNNTITSGTNITQQNCNFTNCGTTYWWNVTVWDDNGSAMYTEWYSFTTESCYDDNVPVLGNETPSNSTSSVSVTTNQLTIDIYDDNASYDWKIEVSDGGSSTGSNGNGEKTHAFDSNLNYSTNYTWWTNVTDSNATVYNYWYWFVTESPEAYSETAPYVENENPQNNSIDIPITNKTISIDIYDNYGNFTYKIETSDGASAVGQDTNGTKSLVYDNNLNYSSQIVWWCNVTNTYNNSFYSWNFTFKTESAPPPVPYDDTPPTISSPNPANNSVNVDYQIDLSITITDENGSFNWFIACSNGENTFGSNTNGTKTLTLSDLDFNTTYTWWVNISDTNGTWYNYSFVFTTQIEVTDYYTRAEADAKFLEQAIDFDPEFMLFFLWLLLLWFWFKSESENMTYALAGIFIPYDIIFTVFILPVYMQDVNIEYWTIAMVFFVIALIVGGFTIDMRRKREKK